MLGHKRVLITGAARGMGREIALEAARQGATHVGLTDIAGDGLEETRALVEAEGARAHAEVVDLRCSEQIEQMIDAIGDWAGGLDTLVNNAGVLDHLFTPADRVSVDTLEESAWDAVNDINLKAVWLATKYAAPYLLASDRGPSIVNAASVSGMTGAGMTAYAVTKAAVIQLTRTTAINLAPKVRANSYSPGPSRLPWETRT
jgi:NAD(P)-dependent dehydrogenase (short-subunit alcohol dehydrogenase family)